TSQWPWAGRRPSPRRRAMSCARATPTQDRRALPGDWYVRGSYWGSDAEMDAVVGSLFVYPVKSCRGIAVDEAEVGRRGFRHDRRWMIVDAAGEFVTQRTEPRLALVDVAIDPEHAALRLAAPGLGTLTLDIAPRHGARVRARVWHDEVEA